MLIGGVTSFSQGEQGGISFKGSLIGRVLFLFAKGGGALQDLCPLTCRKMWRLYLSLYASSRRALRGGGGVVFAESVSRPPASGAPFSRFDLVSLARFESSTSESWCG